jgi:IclR family pca regulon transcriptional regulator
VVSVSDPLTDSEEDDTAGDAPERGGRSRDFVQSLERGLTIIRSFSAERPSMTVSELAEQTGLTRAAVRRFVLTLSELGYIYAKKNHFELTPRVLELGYAYLSALSFPEVALPRIEQLVTETAEASEASILDRGDIVYVLRVPGPSMMTISVNVGARRPAHATSMGRVLLAYLPPDELDDYFAHHELTRVLPRTISNPDALRTELKKVRKQGYALIDQELEDGLIAVAVPIHDRQGRVRAAINISTHVGRKSLADLVALVPTIQAAAGDIEVSLRHALMWSE